MDSLTIPQHGWRLRVMLARAEGSQPRPSHRTDRKWVPTVDEFLHLRRIRPPAETRAWPSERLRAGEVDIATFASSSTVKNLVRMLEGDVAPLKKTCVACIGPVTAATAKELGLDVAIVAREHTIPGLVDAILEGKGGLT